MIFFTVNKINMPVTQCATQLLWKIKPDVYWNRHGNITWNYVEAYLLTYFRGVYRVVDQTPILFKLHTRIGSMYCGSKKSSLLSVCLFNRRLLKVLNDSRLNESVKSIYSESAKKFGKITHTDLPSFSRSQICVGDFFKYCGTLRKPELNPLDHLRSIFYRSESSEVSYSTNK